LDPYRIRSDDSLENDFSRVFSKKVLGMIRM